MAMTIWRMCVCGHMWVQTCCSISWEFWPGLMHLWSVQYANAIKMHDGAEWKPHSSHRRPLKWKWNHVEQGFQLAKINSGWQSKNEPNLQSQYVPQRKTFHGNGKLKGLFKFSTNNFSIKSKYFHFSLEKLNKWKTTSREKTASN